MYEKIVRGLVGVGSQTPYNPVSNFFASSGQDGGNTIGYFRAVAFSSKVVLTPPDISAIGDNEQVTISFPTNKFFTKYNLYWSDKTGVNENSFIIGDIQFNTNNSIASFVHDNLTHGNTYYYRIQVEDAEGNISVLSPEISAVADSSSGGSGNDFNIQLEAGTGQITIRWNEVVGGSDYYILWNTSPGVDINGKVIYENGLKSPYIHIGLTKGVTYFYVVAYKANGIQVFSKEISAVPN